MVSAQPLCVAARFNLRQRSLSRYAGASSLHPCQCSSTPISIRAHSIPPLSSSLLCARACRTVALIRPLAFHGGQSDKHGSRDAKQIAADQMSVHLPSPCTARPSPHSQEVKGALRSELLLQHTHTHTHTHSLSSLTSNSCTWPIDSSERTNIEGLLCL